MKSNKAAKDDYEGLVAFSEDFAEAPLSARQKRMLRTFAYNEVFVSATLVDKKVVLAFAALYYAGKAEQKSAEEES